MSISNNRLANTKNIYQTDAKRVLCLCSAGLLRSPTIANAVHEKFKYNTRAAGVSEEYALVYADQALCFWADEIVCAEKDIANQLVDAWVRDKRIVVLDLPDKYSWGDPELISLCLKQYEDSRIMEKAYTN